MRWENYTPNIFSALTSSLAYFGQKLRILVLDADWSCEEWLIYWAKLRNIYIPERFFLFRSFFFPLQFLKSEIGWGKTSAAVPYFFFKKHLFLIDSVNMKQLQEIYANINVCCLWNNYVKIVFSRCFSMLHKDNRWNYFCNEKTFKSQIFFFHSIRRFTIQSTFKDKNFIWNWNAQYIVLNWLKSNTVTAEMQSGAVERDKHFRFYKQRDVGLVGHRISQLIPL